MCERGATDIHQHLWPEPLVEQLRIRTRPPRLDGWTLHLAGEPPFEVRPEDHDPLRRARLDPGLRRVAVSLSSPLGIEQLPSDEASPLLNAWHQGVRELPEPFVGWASAHAADPDLDGLKALLSDRLIGLQIPATAMATPRAVEKLAPLLAVAEAAGKPVLVHPGPQPPREEETPPWWPAVVGHVGQLHAAWWSWYAAGRTLLPRLRICFVAAAGLAPVHHERFTMRGGGQLRLDPRVFVDTSSYGRQALDAVARVLGIDALVLGSDRPYATPVDPQLGAAVEHAVRVSNPRHLLEGVRP
ncbi:amidohydrolase family protein [Streptomyces xylophagus]|uniref:amidohydrolase family protein n=1 Tax=Streptomyces xylophagus TaxID=285514 RepID=UPI0005B8B3B3|nr:amidohydrolase [Streptomyces xylophagus]